MNTMNQPLDLNCSVIERIRPECSRKLFGFGQSTILVPGTDPDHVLFHLVIDKDCKRLVELKPEQGNKRIPGNPYDLVIRAALCVREFNLTFPAIGRDSKTHNCDLLCRGMLHVVVPQRFVEQFLPMATLGAPLRKDRLQAWVSQQLRVVVARCLAANLRDWSLAEVQDEGVFPPGWWEEQFRETLEPLGLRLTGVSLKWESAEALRKQQADEHQRALEQQRQHAEEADRLLVSQAQREVALASALESLEAERSRKHAALVAAGLATAAQLKKLEEEYQHQRVITETKHREEQLEAERALQKTRQQIERDALEHELSMLRLREEFETDRKRRAEEIQTQAEEKARSARTRADAAETELERMREILNREKQETESRREVARLQIEIKKEEAEKARAEAVEAQQRADAAKADRLRADVELNRAREELRQVRAIEDRFKQVHASESARLDRVCAQMDGLVRVFTQSALLKLFSERSEDAYDPAGWASRAGMSADDLRELGILTPQQFIERFRQGTIEIRKSNLRKRNIVAKDIFAGPIREMIVETLPIRERVDFEFLSPRSGYVTIINPGTSGAFFLHAPNGYRTSPYIEAGKLYHVPGPEILPEEELRRNGLAYYEGGPPGWEYLVVIVSDEPLVQEKLLVRSAPRRPIIELSQDEMQEIVDCLDGLEREKWAAGMAQFRVENQ